MNFKVMNVCRGLLFFEAIFAEVLIIVDASGNAFPPANLDFFVTLSVVSKRTESCGARCGAGELL